MINLQPRRRALVKLTYKTMNLCTTYGNYMKTPQKEKHYLTWENKLNGRT